MMESRIVKNSGVVNEYVCWLFFVLFARRAQRQCPHAEQLAAQQ